MPLQSQDGCVSCIRRTTSSKTSPSGAPDATSASTSDLKSSRSPVFSLIDGILPYTERLPPMITPPRKEISKPWFALGGVSRNAPIRPTLAGEESRPLVDGLLQSASEERPDVERRAPRVVAFGLRAGGSVPPSCRSRAHPSMPCPSRPVADLLAKRYGTRRRKWGLGETDR